MLRAKSYFAMEDLSLELGQFCTEPLPPTFAKRAAAIVEATRSLRHITTPQFVYASWEAHTDHGDSDAEAPRDDHVPSLFTWKRASG